MVELDVQLRRTSARGWGPWTPATITLGSLPDGVVNWHAEDPVAVGLPAIRGPITATFTEIDDVWLRPVRFRTEAFWGMDAEIVVLRSERATSELALAPDLTGPLLDRLAEQLGLADDDA
ncbi:hypothetical protein KSP35_22155 [Aquihabitans sp. G128]|uniref:hypothetical protein n=1 Tax=Aquihabitans sp. G128 TaxID=2849779 RepID=UPI001C228817|nr:hypothetical protein [Aquihabitans sp. G128]QXC60983.1 hypothetical protein KSP35_22155 [Aquihabitans sp. G128]